MDGLNNALCVGTLKLEQADFPRAVKATAPPAGPSHMHTHLLTHNQTLKLTST